MRKRFIIIFIVFLRLSFASGLLETFIKDNFDIKKVDYNNKTIKELEKSGFIKKTNSNKIKDWSFALKDNKLLLLTSGSDKHLLIISEEGSYISSKEKCTFDSIYKINKETIKNYPPLISFNNLKYECNRNLDKGEIFKLKMELFNFTKKDVLVKKISGGCSCITFDNISQIISPNKFISINAFVHSASISGNFEKNIIVEIEDKNKIYLQTKIEGKVVDNSPLNKKMLFFGRIPYQVEASEVFTLKGYTQSQILSVTSPNNLLKIVPKSLINGIEYTVYLKNEIVPNGIIQMSEIELQFKDNKKLILPCYFLMEDFVSFYKKDILINNDTIEIKGKKMCGINNMQAKIDGVDIDSSFTQDKSDFIVSIKEINLYIKDTNRHILKLAIINEKDVKKEFFFTIKK